LAYEKIASFFFVSRTTIGAPLMPCFYITLVVSPVPLAISLQIGVIRSVAYLGSCPKRTADGRRKPATASGHWAPICDQGVPRSLRAGRIRLESCGQRTAPRNLERHDGAAQTGRQIRQQGCNRRTTGGAHEVATRGGAMFGFSEFSTACRRASTADRSGWMEYCDVTQTRCRDRC